MPEPAVLLGDGEAEDAELAHLVEDVHRDQDVLSMNVLRLRDHLCVDELRELRPDLIQHLVVEAGVRQAVVARVRGDLEVDAPVACSAENAVTSGEARSRAGRPR